MKIKSVDGTVLYESDHKTLREAAEAAVKAGTSLAEADLRGADLRDANLYGANLRGAYLHSANLQGVNLSWADLHGADFAGAKVAEGAVVVGCSPFLSLGPLGFRRDNLLVFNTTAGVIVYAGCWIGGLDEFRERVMEVHGDSRYGREYLAAIAMIRAWGFARGASCAAMSR